jgi:hypothetical protein
MIAPPQITNASTTESAEDIAAAGKHYGIEFEIGTIKTGIATEEEAAEAAKAEESSKPGEGDTKAEAKPDANPESKTAAELEAAKTAEGDYDPDATKGDPRDDRKKMLKRIDALTGRWKTEKANRESLETDIADLRRQVSELSKKEPATETKPAAEAQPEAPKRPERPKAPRLADFKFDQEQYETALEKFETETLPAYETARDEWTSAEAVRKVREDQERASQEQYLAQEAEEWHEVLAAHEGLEDRLKEATSMMMSPAMETAMRGVYTHEERAVILEHLLDHPEDTERIMNATLPPGGRERVNAAEWAMLTSAATRELDRIIHQKPAKATPAAEKPAPKPEVKTAPAKPKPPVSEAPPPMEPVTVRPGGAEQSLDSEGKPWQDYAKIREQQQRERRKLGAR